MDFGKTWKNLFQNIKFEKIFWMIDKKNNILGIIRMKKKSMMHVQLSIGV